jgi:hypothetical protein
MYGFDLASCGAYWVCVVCVFPRTVCSQYGTPGTSANASEPKLHFVVAEVWGFVPCVSGGIEVGVNRRDVDTGGHKALMPGVNRGGSRPLRPQGRLKITQHETLFHETRLKRVSCCGDS